MPNAGINGVLAPIEDITPEEWDQTQNINVRGTFLTVKYAIPHLRAVGGGSIVVVSSVNGNRIFSNFGFTSYSCSKAAQVTFAKMAGAVPEDATPEQIALHRTMLAPWQAEAVVELTTAELGARAGRTLTPDDLQLLGALGIVHGAGEDRWAVTPTQLAVGVGLIDLGFPTETAVAAAEVYARHGREVAEELNELFRTQVWPAYKEAGASAETIREVVERIKPLSIASLVSAYEQAMDETRRERIRARAERGSR